MREGIKGQMSLYRDNKLSSDITLCRIRLYSEYDHCGLCM